MGFFGMVAPPGAGLGLLATERLRPAGGSLGEAHPRWFQSYGRDWLYPAFCGCEHRSCGRQRKQAPRSDSAASEDAEVLRCHERCGMATHLLDGREGPVLSGVSWPRLRTSITKMSFATWGCTVAAETWQRC